MNFQNLSKIENYKFYLDLAIKRAKIRANKLKNKLRTRDHIKKVKEIELDRINTLRNVLVERFQDIVNSYPKIDELPKFYNELAKCTLDVDQLKKSMGSMNWAIKKIERFYTIYNKKIKSLYFYEKILSAKNEYYGRVCSVVKQMDPYFTYIEECRRTLKRFPTIKTSVKTIAIVGFPNVGKTTLLFKLTGSKPEIQNYAFTTININVSYLSEKEEKIQILDTPGSLNRFNKMNPIEKQSYLAIKYLAETLIYVFDLTDSYPLEDQEKLFDMLNELDKKIVIYVSKIDILDKKRLELFIKKYPKEEIFTDADELKKILY